jgi:hypothetical protein
MKATCCSAGRVTEEALRFFVETRLAASPAAQRRRGKLLPYQGPVLAAGAKAVLGEQQVFGAN